jgi:uncharacterized iron-regulated membrane protein
LNKARTILVILHRYAGLTMALFLFVAGVTGSLLAFPEELDAWLNPELFRTTNEAAPLDIDRLVEIVERHDPRIKVQRVNLSPAPGHSALIEVVPRGKDAPHPGYDELFVDAATGTVLGQRLWGAFRIDRAHFVPFLYRLHDRLHLPGRWGVWLMGGIAILWTLDCFVGFYLTLPRRRAFLAKWRRAWLIATHGGAYRLNFDLHRAGGLWLWLLLLALAISSVSLNLRWDLFQPAVSFVSPVTPNIFDRREPGNGPQESRLPFSQALKRGEEEAARLGWNGRTISVRYIAGYDIITVQFHFTGNFRDEWRWVHLDGQDGRFLEGEWLGQGSGGDIFTQAQFPIHSGRLLGLPGRILIAVGGMITAALAVTGVVIWWKKRRGRHRRA